MELSESLKREIGQHFVVGFHGHDVSDDIAMLITKYYVGNVILMKRNVHDIKQVHDLVRNLQLLAKNAGHTKPLMIGIDQENGLVSAFSASAAGTQFPGAMALGASGSVELAERVTAASAKEMRMAGINWVYSPVTDINSDPQNPVIGVRSFSDDHAEVAQFAAAVSRGLTSTGIAASAKHFPGHGNTHVDSHLNLPRILTNREDLDKTELVPIKSLIDDGIATIMTGHMALPLITGDDTPCSLSKAVTTDMLRVELGFQGVIVTDCLEMEAVARQYGSQEGAVLSLQAGADVAMICHRLDRQQGAVEATYVAVSDGRLSGQALHRSGARIAALKDAFTGTWDEVLSSQLDMDLWITLKRENEVLSKVAYAKTITITDEEPEPLPKEGVIAVFTPQIASINPAVDDAEGLLRDEAGRLRNTAGPSFQAFAASVARRVSMEHIVYTPEGHPGNIEEQLKNVASVIFATRNGRTAGWQMAYLRTLVGKLGGRPLALVSTCAPYDLAEMRGIRAVKYATYEYTVPALEAVVAVIFGEQAAHGRIPVRL